MELSVFDRLLLLPLLPSEGDITTLRIVRQLANDLSFSEEEHKLYGIKYQDNKASWKLFESQVDAEGNILTDDAGNPLPDPERPVTQIKDIPIGPKALRLIGEALEKLSVGKNLKASYIDLYDRFVEPEKKD